MPIGGYCITCFGYCITCFLFIFFSGPSLGHFLHHVSVLYISRAFCLVVCVTVENKITLERLNVCLASAWSHQLRYKAASQLLVQTLHAKRCTDSSSCMSFDSWGSQTVVAYSRWGRINATYSCFRASTSEYLQNLRYRRPICCRALEQSVDMCADQDRIRC